MTLGEIIRSEREKRGFSKNALAELALISPTHLDKIEKEESVPSIEVAARIKNVLKLPAEVFFESAGGEVLTPAEVDVAIEQRTQDLCVSIGSPYEADAVEDVKKFRYKDKIALLEYLRMFEKEEPATPVEKTRRLSKP